MNTDETTPDHGFTDRPLPDHDRAIAFVMERRWLPGPDGTPADEVVCTNVPHHAVDLAARGFDWGNSGPGAHDLALNILETALRRLDHGGPRSRRLDGSCYTLALILRATFLRRFLATLPEEGGIIHTADVDDWLQERTAALDPVQRAVLSPRYVCADLHPEDDWSAPDLELILGTPLKARPDGLYTEEGRRIARLVQPHPLDTAEWETLPL